MSFRRLIPHIFALFLCGAIASTAQGVPQAFNYQGVARDASGEVLANQAMTVRASIIDGGSSAVLYTETHAVTTNTFGLFTLAIGTGTPVSGTFAAVDWSAGIRELGVALDLGAGFVDLGSSRLLSVPYALAAGSAGAGNIALDDLTNVSVGAPRAGDALVYNGSEWIAGTVAAALQLPYADTLASDQLTPLLSLTQTGGGTVLNINQTSGIAVTPAVSVRSAGQAPAILGVTTNTTNAAGRFLATNRNHIAPALYAQSDGVGNAGSFFINNTNSDSAAVRGVTVGTGAGVYGQSTANGRAYGLFGTALGECIVDQNGVTRFCPAGVFGESRRGPGVYGFNTDSGPGVQAFSEKGKLFLGLGPSTVNSFPDQEFWVDNEGATFARGGLRTPGTYHSTLPASAARIATSDTGLKEGDVVSVTTGGAFVESRGANDTTVVGIAVRNAALMTGISFNDLGEPTNLNGSIGLAVSGIVTVNVSAENGTIVPGNLLVAASLAGHAMRAPADPAVGTVVAKAVTGYAGSTEGTIQAIIMLR